MASAQQIGWRPSLSTLKHLRFSFSLFLSPVFFFWLAEDFKTDFTTVLRLFVVLMLCLFPASNGYNSYFDRDSSSIGGLKRPPAVTEDLLFYSLLIEYIGLILALVWWGPLVAFLFFLYGVFSKLYSHPRIRLKRFPWVSWLIVAFFQGAVMFVAMSLASAEAQLLERSWLQKDIFVKALISAVMIGCSYPMTQIYQHEEDKQRGDLTLSRHLGVRGTFVFSGGLSVLFLSLIFFLWGFSLPFLVLLVCLLPLLIYQVYWSKIVWQDPAAADFANTHRFLLISALGINIAFLTIFTGRVFNVF